MYLQLLPKSERNLVIVLGDAGMGVNPCSMQKFKKRFHWELLVAMVFTDQADAMLLKTKLSRHSKFPETARHMVIKHLLWCVIVDSR